MKILVIGYYFSHNLGDAVICDCTAERLHSAYPTAEIIVADIWGRTEFSKVPKRSVKDVEKRYRFLRTIGTISKYTIFDLEWLREQRSLNGSKAGMNRVASTDCDVVVFAGGQLLMDWFSVAVSYYIQKFSERNIPVLINAAGTGPEYSRKIRRLFSESLMNPDVTWISSRDRNQYVTKRYLKNGKKCFSVTDPALWTDKVYQICCRQKPLTAKDAFIGLGMILPYNMNYKVLSHFWKKMILFLEEKNIPWKIVLNGGDTDELFARKFLTELGMTHSEITKSMLSVPKQPVQLAENIASLRGLISFRLHSHIMAASLGVPSVAIVWDQKVRSFFHKIGHPERCLTLKDSPEKIWASFKKAEKEGYNRNLILAERTYSEQRLLQAVDRALHKDE